MIFCRTQKLTQYLVKIFNRYQSRKINKLDIDKEQEQTQEPETTSWIEDFDEREKNWR